MSAPEYRFTLRSCRAQSGAALLILLALIAIATGAFLVNTFGASDHLESRERRTEAALAEAKEALISYAAAYADTHSGEVPGYLPCPDFDGGNPEGSAELQCGALPLVPGTPIPKDNTVMGRLPWRTLGLPNTRDGGKECLWYVVSGNFKSNPKTDLMNWDTNGLITVTGPDGNALATGNTPSGAVAVIFAPGPAIGGQSRTGVTAPICGGNYAASNYLDTSGGTNNADMTGIGANNIKSFIAGAAVAGTFNDRLIFITAAEIFDAIERRQHVDPTVPATNPPTLVSFSTLLLNVTRRTAECIADYPTYDNNLAANDWRLPWTTDQPFGSNDYGVNTNYDDTNNRFLGRTPLIVNRSITDTGSRMDDPPLLTTTLLAEAICPGWGAVETWWQNWNDHIFYAVSEDFAPNGDDDDTDCGDCVSVIAPGPDPEYAGIVFFAGKRLNGQARNNNPNASTSTAKGQRSNYLEGENATTGTNGTGNFRTGAESPTFNDVLYCINEDLSVMPCPQ